MKEKTTLQDISRPLQDLSFRKLFLLALPFLAVMVLCTMHPPRLDAGDFSMIVLEPGRQLLQAGSVNPGYPYPLWTVLLFLPFALLPVQLAMTLWLLCNILMLTASLVLLIKLFELRVSLASLVLLVVLTVFFLPSLSSLWLGQLTIFTLLILALITYFFLRQKWVWLGVVLGLSFIKPQAIPLLVGLVLAWSLWQRKWRVFLGFFAVIVFLVLVSLPFISFPGQIIGGGISQHLSFFLDKTSTLWGLLLYFGLPWAVPAALSIIALIFIVWLWLPVLKISVLEPSKTFFLFSMAVLVNLIIIPYSWMHGLVLLLYPFGTCLAVILKQEEKSRRPWIIVLLVLMQPLMLFCISLVNPQTDTQAFLVIPAILLLPLAYYLGSRALPQKV